LLTGSEPDSAARKRGTTSGRGMFQLDAEVLAPRRTCRGEDTQEREKRRYERNVRKKVEKRVRDVCRDNHAEKTIEEESR